ncbi:MAG: hypothetical protein K2N64_06420 [Anaeroplasmataceae bacterium]|nr:hypothetical protein [Anaeroplasmataceae bacterium]
MKLLFCLLIHELGHLVFIFLFRYKIKELRLSVFGFFLSLDHTREVFIKDLFIYSGGILLNLICFLFIPDETIKKMSLILICFNSLPVYPLDGFNIGKTLISYCIPYRLALNCISIISMICGAGIFLYTLFMKLDLFILLNAGYLFILSIIYYFKKDILYQKFLLEKNIYPYSYPIKTISFRDSLSKSLYKYHTIQMKIGNKIISQEELIQTKAFSMTKK